jgi:hypothetical protein
MHKDRFLGHWCSGQFRAGDDVEGLKRFSRFDRVLSAGE